MSSNKSSSQGKSSSQFNSSEDPKICNIKINDESYYNPESDKIKKALLGIAADMFSVSYTSCCTCLCLIIVLIIYSTSGINPSIYIFGIFTLCCCCCLSYNLYNINSDKKNLIELNAKNDPNCQVANFSSS
jgi:hypothetical protein